LKINVKLGGLNSIPGQHHSMGWLRSAPPAIVVGADVAHPGPGVQRPSISALVSSVDEHGSQYIASSNIQEPRMEMIKDLKEMFKNAMTMFNGYQLGVKKRDIWPQRVLFFRDGVSEGEYAQVMEQEYTAIQQACEELLKENKSIRQKPTITFVIVGKRHHTRFFPTAGSRPSKSGNCPPGLVIDTEIISPNMFDFFLQSHAGLLGTSRPSHYVVLKDENKFTPDSLQALCYTLCHVYQRATRSVSIPAPVYYADIVCARADFHFDPDYNFMSEETSSSNADAEFNLDHWKAGWRGINPSQKHFMYFM